MPRKKRSKSPSLVPHLTNPSKPNHNKRSSSKRIKKVYTYKESPCCYTIQIFIESLMKNFVVLSFPLNFIAWIFTTYYLNHYLQSHLIHTTTEPPQSHTPWLSHIILLLSITTTLTIHSYLYLMAAFIIHPKGHDLNAYSVGRGKFNPYRVFKFIYTCCQSLHTLLYANSYFYIISSFQTKCKRLTLDGDLDNMEYSDYSTSVLKAIISSINENILRNIANQQRMDRNYLKQAHYDDILKHDPAEIRKHIQTNPYEMISIFNVHYDKKDPDQYANIFLPPSLTLSMNYIPPKKNGKNGKLNGSYRGHTNLGKNEIYSQLLLPPTPAIIFLVGGAWGSCDITYSCSAASSFITHKVAFIYPTYRVYPEGNVQDMIHNINAIIKYVIKYASALNINPNHICIVGQSSGAHLGALSILRAYQEKSKWLKRVRLFCGLAGPYCITDHYQFESNRGIENLSPMGRCMKGVDNFAFYSPSVIVQEILTAIKARHRENQQEYERELRRIKERLPHFLLLHTKPDYVVPTSSSKKFEKNLNKLNVDCEYIEYAEGSHYDTLFGLCDKDNLLFNRLIIDISSRLFILCKQYNERKKVHKSSKTSPSSSGIDEKEHPQTQNNQSMEHLDINYHPPMTVKQPQRQIQTQQQQQQEVEEEEEEKVEEFYEEEDEEVVRFQASREHNQQNTAAVQVIEEEEEEDEDDENVPDIQQQTMSLPRAHSLHIIETEAKTDDDDGVDETEEVTKDGDGETEGWIDVGLFKYDDISADVNKTDETVEFMKHILSDMDKALNAISSLNRNTAGQIEEIEEMND